MDSYSDKKIINSWEKNVPQWVAAVRGGEIESRELLTNQVVLDAVLRYSPHSVLDVGCGEGWLVRALAPYVKRLVGVDAVPELVQQAKVAGGGEFFVAPYDAIFDSAVTGAFDVLVCNFSLLGKESVEALFKAAPSFLEPGGVLIVQTLHPVFASSDQPYVEGWRDGSWAGFSASFCDPAPWYFRTLANWMALFFDHGFQMLEVLEPIHPITHKPASIVFIAKHKGINCEE